MQKIAPDGPFLARYTQALAQRHRGVFLHSKYLFQADASAQRNAKAGTKLRATHSLRLDLNAGKYTLALDLISVPAEAF